MFIVLGNFSGIAEQQHLKISRLHAELACLTPTPRPGTGRLVLSVLAGVALSVGGPGHYFQDLFMAAFTAFLDALGERELSATASIATATPCPRRPGRV